MSSKPEASDPLRVYFDADVLFAGAASPSERSASQVLLTLSEITLIEGYTSDLAVEECRRNLAENLPAATGDLKRLAGRALSAVEAPLRKMLVSHAGPADWKDLPHLVAALKTDCLYLTTYNISDYDPGHPDIVVLRPGALVRRARRQLGAL